jgi:uncharacterized membrane protein
MVILMALVALAAAVAAIAYAVKKQWRLAGICAVVFVLALIISNTEARRAQTQQAAQGNFPITLNSGGTIPK